jgi:hypothetical protein
MVSKCGTTVEDFRRMLKMARLLTHPAPARQDAPFRGKAAASEGPRRYIPHFVWAVRPCNGSWRTEKPIQFF